ncbi:hypothetical protein PV326_012956, partial [Microctonus aethiopoides]
IAVRHFVSEISSFECRRIRFHSITAIEATTSCTANQTAVLKSGENCLQDSIDRMDGFSGPIDQNLEKIQRTSFSHLSRRNLLKNKKMHYFSTVRTTPYLLQVDCDCEVVASISVLELKRIFLHLKLDISETKNRIAILKKVTKAKSTGYPTHVMA